METKLHIVTPLPVNQGDAIPMLPTNPTWTALGREAPKKLALDEKRIQTRPRDEAAKESALRALELSEGMPSRQRALAIIKNIKRLLREDKLITARQLGNLQDVERDADFIAAAQAQVEAAYALASQLTPEQRETLDNPRFNKIPSIKTLKLLESYRIVGFDAAKSAGLILRLLIAEELQAKQPIDQAA